MSQYFDWHCFRLWIDIQVDQFLFMLPKVFYIPWRATGHPELYGLKRGHVLLAVQL